MPAEKFISQFQSIQQQQSCKKQLSSTNMTKFSLLDSPHAVTAILSAALQAQVSHNDALPPATMEDMTIFHAMEPPSISVVDYVTRVQKYVFCSEACLIGAYHYLTQAVRADPKLALTSLSIHRMFITAIVIACKYFDDISYTLPYYSKVGGLPHKELANLELHMLKLLNFKLDISPIQFVKVENHLISLILNIKPTDDIVEKLVEKAKYQLEYRNIIVQDAYIQNQLVGRYQKSTDFITNRDDYVATSPLSYCTDESDSSSSDSDHSTNSNTSSPDKYHEQEDKLVQSFSSVHVSSNQKYQSYHTTNRSIALGC